MFGETEGGIFVRLRWAIARGSDPGLSNRELSSDLEVVWSVMFGLRLSGLIWVDLGGLDWSRLSWADLGRCSWVRGLNLWVRVVGL